ncbi:MAG: hypothetical protein MK141_14260 [Pseudoxanthomonas sp.]|uniref:hypothetical protein n=1 Tax=Pseudoxanthomonas sp. TaxID=1871049 RepID=UPI00258B271C|nr:hypothetical protein [Pseudoxanthomonas sp.]MCH2092723.1 hypothetical protein [Pseudoxanthomonas sp.]
MSLTTFQGLVDDLVRDKDQVISSSTRDEAIAQAVIRYSDDRPRAVVIDVLGNGTRRLPLPAGWETGYSQLQGVEWPVDQYPAAELSMAEVRMRQAPDNLYIELPVEPGVDEAIRLTYTQRHAVDVATDTIPDRDRLAVASWAAALLCGQLQAYYATEAAPTIQADSADHQGKSERYRTRMRDLTTQYFKELGIPEKRPSVASTVVHMRGTDSNGNPRLFHNRRYKGK